MAIVLWHNYQRRGGLLFVLSGPSGVGKDRLLGEFLRIAPNVRRCVTTTTRPPRNAECDGVDYWFVEMSEFRRMVDAGEFLEHAEVHGNFYGVERRHVEELLAAGHDVILLIDVQGAATVKRWRPDATMVFLAPPSMEELERRLRERGTESENEIAVRLSNAVGEFQRVNEFDYLIVHDSVEDAARQLAAIVTAERCRIERSV